jgi:hypothetical protein
MKETTEREDGIILPTTAIAGTGLSTQPFPSPGMNIATGFIDQDTELSASMMLDGAVAFRDCSPTDGRMFAAMASGIRDVM